MQLGQVFGYVAWHPIAVSGLQPSVRSPYFGHLLAAEFIGGSTSFQVAEVATGDDTLAVYAGYDNGKLVRVVVINYDLWNGSGTRPTRDFTINVPSSTTAGTVKTLTSPGGGTATGSFYWAGLAFSHPNNGVGTVEPTQPQPQDVTAQNGKLTVTVGSSQAVLVQLK